MGDHVQAALDSGVAAQQNWYHTPLGSQTADDTSAFNLGRVDELSRPPLPDGMKAYMQEKQQKDGAQSCAKPDYRAATLFRRGGSGRRIPPAQLGLQLASAGALGGEFGLGGTGAVFGNQAR